MNQRVLWSGRFAQGTSDRTLAFTTSLDVDNRMAFYDVVGSLAHVRQLVERDIIDPSSGEAIEAGLKGILSDLWQNKVEWDGALEDVHSNMEFLLTDRVGEVGGRLHTGRSRNDQVATDFRLYLRDAVLDLMELLMALQTTLVCLADEHMDTLMPGFTHMQHAQPVSLGFHMMAHFQRFQRDGDRLMDSFDRINVCPLGSAALAGTTYPLDRHATASMLAFDRPSENAMDAVSDRDFAVEVTFVCALAADHLSSLCEELVMWSGPEFGFVEMSDLYSTGSSIMPQKKNPDVCELVRGRTGSVIGDLTSMLIMLKGLPFAYNRDLQEDKAPVFHAVDTVLSCLDMTRDVLDTMIVDKERMGAVTEDGFINATDLADHLVTLGLPFRKAHEVVGGAVRLAIEKGGCLEELSLDELKGLCDLVGDDVVEVLPVRRCMERRNTYGGTSPESVSLQILEAESCLRKREEFIGKRRDSIALAFKALTG